MIAYACIGNEKQTVSMSTIRRVAIDKYPRNGDRYHRGNDKYVYIYFFMR